jgi:hypothetical protein
MHLRNTAIGDPNSQRAQVCRRRAAAANSSSATVALPRARTMLPRDSRRGCCCRMDVARHGACHAKVNQLCIAGRIQQYVAWGRM